MYKSGPRQGDLDMGTRVRGLGDARRGTEDIKYGTWGRVGRGRGDCKHRDAGDAGTIMIIEKSEVNAISVTFFVNMFW